MASFLKAIKSSDNGNKSSQSVPTDEQCFLLSFIMGAFLGPDLKGEIPRKSVMQRRAEGLALYSFDQLEKNHMKKVDLERIYYHILKQADQSFIMKPSWLDLFFQGNLLTFSGYPQFPNLFPPRLHPQCKNKSRYKIFKNIVLIDTPDLSYLEPRDVERFRRLTGLDDINFDKGWLNMLDVSLPSASPSPSLQWLKANGNESCNGDAETNGFVAPLQTETNGGVMEKGDSAGLILLSNRPTQEEWENIAKATKSGTVLTGTAVMGQMGRVIGHIDIGECEESYLFRVYLPGVKRDEREFVCEVESDGKVMISGVTTVGEEIVHRNNMTFRMQTQNFCPIGHFAISFKLPGPVDPQQFSGNFGTDGILEGIVMKESSSQDSDE
ncbi:increased DNA methylation 2 [Impatiens glandulifera]|uniref:increased DNA methylation 2 n=1 Tax=Impatiens glandulifera TaxID=253017 RepID=UPI001FB12009|nr:increased DNA methylation 2 [Impatiens glandulifera]